jgi:hypothetical protein
MKLLLSAVITVSIAVIASCDMRSGTAKEEMEKFSGTPTPTISPTATPTPIDPGDIVQVDTSVEGDVLSVNGQAQKTTLKCDKFNRVMINSNVSTINITGACSQIMVNGSGNQITADAASEFVFNGADNSLKYARFANGKQPFVTDNQSANKVEKIPFEPQRNTGSKSTTGK